MPRQKTKSGLAPEIDQYRSYLRKDVPEVDLNALKGSVKGFKADRNIGKKLTKKEQEQIDRRSIYHRESGQIKRIDDLRRSFITLFKDCCHSQSRGKLFADWLEISSLAMHQLMYLYDDPEFGKLEKDEHYYRIEEKYLEAVKGYDEKTLTTFSQMLSIMIVASSYYQTDFLSEFYMMEELGCSRLGQIFTPKPIAALMARISLGSKEEMIKIIEEKGQITIYEPTVGGGVMVVAAAEYLEQLEINPQIYALFECCDVSRDCFNMTYLTCCCLGLQARVCHGNTISMEMWECRPTHQLVFYRRWLMKRRDELEAQQREMEKWEKFKQVFLSIGAAETGEAIDTETDDGVLQEEELDEEAACEDTVSVDDLEDDLSGEEEDEGI